MFLTHPLQKHKDKSLVCILAAKTPKKRDEKKACNLGRCCPIRDEKKPCNLGRCCPILLLSGKIADPRHKR
jgi:hypothetical protein